MNVSVIIQSRGNILANIKHSIACYIKQKQKDKELILVIDQEFTDVSYKARLHELCDGDESFLEKENIRLFTNLNANFIHQNVSALRNFAAQQAKGVFINFMDDDEDFHSDYLVKSLEYRKKYRKIIGKDFVLTPTLMYRHTGNIQNQGFSSFNYRLSRPIPCVLGQKEYSEIKMYSGNSLFGPAYIFQQNKMDERFDFVYEDLDYTHSLSSSGYPIVVTKNIKIYHMEREKNKLEQAWVGNVWQAYKKSKHRILFVKKHSNGRQKISFYLIGFRGQPLWLLMKVIFLGKKTDILPITKAMRKGMVDALKNH